jgi:phosphotransferase system HPr (HPr) family protein
MNERRVKLSGPLHARPASLIASAANNFAASLTLHIRDRSADARSVLSVMALDVDAGQEIVIRAAGADAEGALDSVERVLREVGEHSG